MPTLDTLVRLFAQLGESVLRLGAPRPRVFINYRREGSSAGYGHRIAERLIEHFGPNACFVDIRNLQPGVDFVRAIGDAIRGCKAMIVVIGRDWLTQTTEQGGRRLDDPRDFVRNEVRAALRADIRIIPVLVGRARMPSAEQLPEALKAVARRHAQELSDASWEHDIGKLIASLEAVGLTRRRKGWPNVSRQVRTGIAALALIIMVLSATALAVALLRERDVPPPPVPLAIPVMVKPSDSVPPERPAVVPAIAPPPPAVDPPTTPRVRRQRPVSSQTSVANVSQPASQSTSSRWLVRWSNPTGLYEGRLHLTGSTGSLRVTYTDGGNYVVIDQGIVMRQEGPDIVLQGLSPTVAGTGVAATFYQADHAHVRLGPDGLLYAAFCDQPAHQCYPALLTPLPDEGPRHRTTPAASAAAM